MVLVANLKHPTQTNKNIRPTRTPYLDLSKIYCRSEHNLQTFTYKDHIIGVYI